MIVIRGGSLDEARRRWEEAGRPNTGLLWIPAELRFPDDDGSDEFIVRLMTKIFEEA